MSKKEQRSRYVEYGDEVEGRYKWDQWEDHVTVLVPFDKNTRAGDLDIKLKQESLYVKHRNEAEPRINGQLFQEIILDESSWIIQDGVVDITLCKKPSKVKAGEIWWASVVRGDPEISVRDIEGAKYLDDSILVKIYEQKQAEKKKRKEEAAAAKAAEQAPSTEE